MLTPSWYPLRPHEKQSKAWRTDKRFVVLAAGRGSGKTEIARRRIVRFLPVKKPWSNPIYFYALPTFEQARRVAWEPIKSLVPKSWVSRTNESRMSIETVFGSTLYVVGMDKPERVEGSQYDGGIIDESSDQKPKVFDKSILPAISHRKGFIWRIGVPKRQGPGAIEFKEVFDRGLSGEDPNTISFAWPSSDILEPEEIETAKALMDIRDYREQYEASWESASGGIFHAFDSVKNVTDTVSYNPDNPIIVSSDFNVDPMCWVIGHRFNNAIHIFDHLRIRNTNTPLSLTNLYNRYGEHKSGWEFYGDAAAAQRKTSASVSDYIHIYNDTRFLNKQVFYRKKNPPIADRFAATNALLCNAKEERRLLIHPRCKFLINDLKQRSYKEGTTVPDDSGDIGHMTDALGYCIHVLFPLQLNIGATPTVITR